MSKYRNRKYRRGFTLFEIKVAVVFMGLLATLVLPAAVNAHKQAQGARILGDCHRLDEAIGEWAHETGQKDGNPVDMASVRSYLKVPGRSLTDELGHAYQLGAVGKKPISINTATKSVLAGVGIDWGAY